MTSDATGVTLTLCQWGTALSNDTRRRYQVQCDIGLHLFVRIRFHSKISATKHHPILFDFICIIYAGGHWNDDDHPRGLILPNDRKQSIINATWYCAQFLDSDMQMRYLEPVKCKTRAPTSVRCTWCFSWIQFEFFKKIRLCSAEKEKWMNHYTTAQIRY